MEKDNQIQNMSDSELEKNHINEDKSKVNVYDNDDAYMLGGEDENNQEITNLEMQNENYQFRNEENYDRNIYKQHNQVNNMNHEDLENNQNEDEGIQNNLELDQEDNKSQFTNLMKIQYISVCQSCKENFNSHLNVPFMMKCGHFFCRNCILNLFSDQEGKIYCPEDQDVIASSLSELKLLNNLISHEDDNPQVQSFCSKHPDQRLTHIIEQSREIVCVHCAFHTFKQNPKIEIKEISECCEEILDNVNSVLENNQHYVEILQNTLKDIKDNKNQEEEKVVSLYNSIISFLELKREEHLDSINNIFSQNADKLSEKLDVFSSKMEEADEFKLAVSQIMNNPDSAIQVVDVITHYENYIKNSEEDAGILELSEFKFIHEGDVKMKKYLSAISELKQKSKIVKFTPKNQPTKSQINLEANQLNTNNNTNNMNQITNTSQKINNQQYLNPPQSQLPSQNSQTKNNNTNNSEKINQINQKPVSIPLSHNNASNAYQNNIKTQGKSSDSEYLSMLNKNNQYNNKDANINLKFDPSNAIKNNYENIRANNKKDESKSHYASVISKQKYDKNYEVLNTEELLREHKESKMNFNTNSNLYSNNQEKYQSSGSNLNPTEFYPSSKGKKDYTYYSVSKNTGGYEENEIGYNLNSNSYGNYYGSGVR